ncbi:Rieske 2Fe-2S domain-containing protein [Streptomyces sp. LP05-1]|uniref:Rieske 2Fe-2S domain-containing protein n=1 Tax=Streptomyces pyxinae TaxID=2970734 RepID=A0ABT2CHM3_9ACTN|nr:Rieske 2Fe-2S domain-containing protein [Streptomyces sp. LP05-1]MCS0636910.1 Rieske 2Fe-2S domain-containing protein [Streptomyces sp. LP05-1]
MPVVSFSVAGRDNCVVVGGTAYVYATVKGRGFVMNAQCPHRGGPLHLADVTADGSQLVCPWHERKTATARLRGRIPSVRTGKRVTAVIPDQPVSRGYAAAAVCGGATSREHRPLSPSITTPVTES